MAYLAMDDFRHRMTWVNYCVYAHGITDEYLSLDYQLTEPHKTRRYRVNRGVRMFCGYTWSFRDFTRVHQCQAPGTLDHTFRLPLFRARTELWYRITAAAGLPTGGHRVSPVFHVMIPDCPEVPPLLAARIYRTTGISVPSGIDTPIPFQVVHFDYGDLADLVAFPTRLTAPVSGLFHIVGALSFGWVPAAHYDHSLFLNGVTQIAELTSGDPPSALFTRYGVSVTWPLAAGDFIQLVANHSVGAPKALEVISGQTPALSMFRIPGSL